ncbi:hypothetical protein [Halobacillus salinus]|uniref:hypothetical protein n=1 Tax=Halobacillus salinus TaxID=192814 RepID=UPI0009A7AA6A|nr:hypothetical protein [Halobacillus salinus]
MTHQNLNIIAPSDCNNAPKKEFIKDALVAFATSDVDFLKTATKENVRWEIVGTDSLQSQSELIDHVTQHPMDINELTIDSIITHGKTGAAKGTYQTTEGDLYHFCHFYHFVSAGKKVIQEITSYVIHQ